MNILEAGIGYLADTLACVASHDATYCRGGDTIPLKVVHGRSLRTLSDEAGGTRVVEIEDDWLIRACDLRLLGGITEPLLGDTIVVKCGPRAGTYTMLQPGMGLPHAERIDVGIRWRCHTKRTKGSAP